MDGNTKVADAIQNLTLGQINDFITQVGLALLFLLFGIGATFLAIGLIGTWLIRKWDNRQRNTRKWR